MIDLGFEAQSRRLERILGWKAEMEGEDSALRARYYVKLSLALLVEIVKEWVRIPHMESL